MNAQQNANKDQDIRIDADDRLNGEAAVKFLATVNSLIGKGVKTVVVDCGRITFLSTPGISTLVMAHCRMKKNGGQMRLQALQPRILQLFETMRLDRLFEISADGRPER